MELLMSLPLKKPDEYGRYKCSMCHTWKLPEQYNKNKKQKTGLSYACRTCMTDHTRKYNLVTKYNITTAKFAEMLLEQGTKCACCQMSFEMQGKQLNRPHVDHNHKTGEIRNLLCGNCNLAAGKVKDSSAFAEQLASYLKKWNC